MTFYLYKNVFNLVPFVPYVTLLTLTLLIKSIPIIESLLML